MKCTNCKKDMEKVRVIDGLGFFDAYICRKCKIIFNITRFENQAIHIDDFKDYKRLN